MCTHIYIHINACMIDTSKSPSATSTSPAPASPASCQALPALCIYIYIYIYTHTHNHRHPISIVGSFVVLRCIWLFFCITCQAKMARAMVTIDDILNILVNVNSVGAHHQWLHQSYAFNPMQDDDILKLVIKEINYSLESLAAYQAALKPTHAVQTAAGSKIYSKSESARPWGRCIRRTYWVSRRIRHAHRTWHSNCRSGWISTRFRSMHRLISLWRAGACIAWWWGGAGAGADAWVVAAVKDEHGANQVSGFAYM